MACASVMACLKFKLRPGLSLACVLLTLELKLG